MKMTFLEVLVILSLLAIAFVLVLPFLMSYFLGVPYDPTPLEQYDLYY